MGGFFGAVGKQDVISAVFYGTDYHSHLGVKRGGLAAFNEKEGLQREIHNIENSPFRTKFANVFEEMSGNSAIGCPAGAPAPSACSSTSTTSPASSSGATTSTTT